MITIPDREVLNLTIDGNCVERFVVTRASWEKFLDKLIREKETPAIQRVEHAAIPSQL